LDYAAGRQNNATETKMRRIHWLLTSQGKQISYADTIAAFRVLQDLEAGQLVLGRRGSHSRFVWSVEMVSLGKAAAGNPNEIQPIPEENLDQEGAEDTDTVSHSYNLRLHSPVTFELPEDLTKGEAERLATFIRTLPIEETE
jgi:hypothetical protein